MHSRTPAAILLSLFTTRERALEIEGDLIEESLDRGVLWFATHVIGTTVALFRASFREAPARITALGAIATGVSCAACNGALPWAFAASPLLGLGVTSALAFAIGFGLACLAPRLGVRAAGLTVVLLTLLFIVTQALARTQQFVVDVEAGVGIALLNAVVVTLASFAFSIVIFLLPLMAGSVYAEGRHAGAS